jgi:hypothetical protein
MLEDNIRRENNSNTRDARNKHFIERNILQSTEFPDRISAKDTKVYYSNWKSRNYRGRLRIYAPLAAGSVAVEGAKASAAGALDGVVEDLGAEVEETADGEIRDTILGTYSFAFWKNPSISERGRAWEEPTFSQSTSSP